MAPPRAPDHPARPSVAAAHAALDRRRGAWLAAFMMRIDPSDLPLRGGCQCGACRFEIGQAPITFYVCHCSECRAQSASAFGISVLVPHGAVRLTSGEPASWSRAADSGGRMECRFCPDCGTRLWHEGDRATSVKGGALDAPPDLAGAAQIWTRGALVALDLGGPLYDGQPETPPPPPRWRPRALPQRRGAD